MGMEFLNDGMQKYALVFARLIGLFFTAPVFNAESVAYRHRIIMAMGVAAILYPGASAVLPVREAGFTAFSLNVMGQAAVGVIIGFMVAMIFGAFQIAGEIFSIQAGVSFSEVLDPQAQISIPIIGTLKNMIGLILFLAVDFQVDGVYAPAYLHMVRALALSFKTLPVFIISTQTAGGLLTHVDQLFGLMFVTALKIGIPIIGILFITSVALGLLSRAAPQMHLMNMGLQINIAVGLVLLFVLMPVIVPLMLDSLHYVYDSMGDMFKTWPHQ
ncbi:MAG: flagellar biosynthetic protein FliR [Spirochaetia bacterium]|nr:flagellar biosynthetic protein FliR [Spirochaetia bacterium]